jgi:hypothetical protein
MSGFPGKHSSGAFAVTLLIVFLVGCGGHKAIGPSPSFPTNAPAVISLNVTYPQQTNFSISDPKQCEAVLKALGAAHEVSAHKCKKRGEMTITLADQKSLNLQILPGHDSASVEFIYQSKYYSGPGTDFYKALKTAGVDMKPSR